MLQALPTESGNPCQAPLPSLDLVAEDIRAMEEILDAALTPFRERFGPIVEHLRHYGGKRLRPTILFLSARASGRVRREHFILAAVVEMIHTATLIHDDVLDGAERRRHAPTVNARWGCPTSLLLGDLLFSAAFRLCSSVDAQACAWIGDATNRVCAGELLQVHQAGNLALDEATYLEIVAGKTGALTECAARLGAWYAGAEPEVVACFAEYGRHLGIAFQIADDLLDLTGSDGVIGKTTGTDVALGKLTLPIIRARDRMDPNSAARLREALQEGDHDEVRRLTDLAGGIESATADGRRQVAMARSTLGRVPGGPYRQALEQLAIWSLTRPR